MADNRISQASISEAIGLDQSAVSRRVAGSRPWKLHEIQALIGYLSRLLSKTVTYEDLFAPEPVAGDVVAHAIPEPDPSSGVR